MKTVIGDLQFVGERVERVHHPLQFVVLARGRSLQQRRRRWSVDPIAVNEGRVWRNLAVSWCSAPAPGPAAELLSPATLPSPSRSATPTSGSLVPTILTQVVLGERIGRGAGVRSIHGR